MTTHNAEVSIADEARTADVPALFDERGPTLLTEAELDHVAAAHGSKPGGSTDGIAAAGSKPGGTGEG